MKRFFVFIALFLFGLSPESPATPTTDGIANPVHRQMLDESRQQAKKQESNNLNRFALETLFRYNKLYDSLYQAEKKDTLARIATAFARESAARRSLADTLKVQVKKATQEKETLRQKYFRLLKRGILALAIWMAIVALMVTLLTKTMRRNRKLLDGSESSLAGYQHLFDDGDKLLKTGATLQPIAAEISMNLEALQALQEELRQQVKSGAVDAASTKEIQARLGEVITLHEKQNGILQALQEQREPAGETKSETDMNRLCRHYLELATSGISTEEFNLKVTTDFEKRLPKINVFPQAIGNLLSHLFSNAIESMRTKATTAGKTYQPTLAVSTRVLPRFIQVRIKDNGTGISDAELENIFDYFYSLNPPSQGAGIGLSEANRIMKEMHNGEIAIESDTDRGTDVYLKFFTVHEKT